MLVLTKDSANTIRVSLAELSTLASPVYLIEFISDMSLISTTCIAPDTSLYPARFNQFTITEQTSPDGLLAQILLEPVGFFTYNIYEQTSATNLSPDDPGVILLETGKARVLIDGDRESTAFTYYQNPTPAWAAWDVFESEGIVPTPPSTDATYENSDASFTQVIAPGTTYVAPDISFTDSDGTIIPTPANTDIVATSCPAPYSNNYSMQLDGIDESITMPSDAALTPSGSISVSLWWKTSTTPVNCHLFSRQFFYCQYAATLGKFSFRVFQNAGTFETLRSTSYTLDDGNWHHILFTYTVGGNQSIYIDGVLNATQVATLTSIFTTSAPIGVGANYLGNGSFYAGQLDEVAYWHNLDLGGIASLIYNGGTPQSLDAFSPSVWLRMGDGATWSGSAWTVPNEGTTGSFDGTSNNMEEADRLLDVP